MEQFTNPEVKRMQEENARAAEEQREMLLTQILTPQAKERLGRVALVKEEKAREVEKTLLTLAMNRQLPGKVSEDQLIAMLEKADTSQKSLKIVRRKGFDSDSDDLEGL